MKDSINERLLLKVQSTRGYFVAIIDGKTVHVYTVDHKAQRTLVADYNVPKDKWSIYGYVSYGTKEKIAEMAKARMNLSA